MNTVDRELLAINGGKSVSKKKEFIMKYTMKWLTAEQYENNAEVTSETLEFGELYSPKDYVMDNSDTDQYELLTTANDDTLTFEFVDIKTEEHYFMVFETNFATRIKAMRLFRGKTIKATSEFLGVPQRTYEDWEGGQRVPDTFKQSAILDKLIAMKNK